MGVDFCVESIACWGVELKLTLDGLRRLKLLSESEPSARKKAKHAVSAEVEAPASAAAATAAGVEESSPAGADLKETMFDSSLKALSLEALLIKTSPDELGELLRKDSVFASVFEEVFSEEMDSIKLTKVAPYIAGDDDDDQESEDDGDYQESGDDRDDQEEGYWDLLFNSNWETGLADNIAEVAAPFLEKGGSSVRFIIHFLHAFDNCGLDDGVEDYRVYLALKVRSHSTGPMCHRGDWPCVNNKTVLDISPVNYHTTYVMRKILRAIPLDAPDPNPAWLFLVGSGAG